MKLYLVRHGSYTNKEYKFNQIDGPLNKNGIKQAKFCSEYFSNIVISQIYSSDLKRAVETANIINLNKGLKINIRSGLREINQGEWEYNSPNDSKYDTFRSEWDKHEHDLPYPNGESGQDVLNRVSKELDNIKSLSNKNESIIIVTHGGVIRSLLAKYSNLNQTKRFNFNPDFCSITILDIKNENVEILNECSVEHIYSE
jgi:broad specificity phosphatase PhoE